MQDNKDFFDDIKIPERLEPDKIAEMINYCKENNQFQNKNIIKNNPIKQDTVDTTQPVIEQEVAEDKLTSEVIAEENVEITAQENSTVIEEKNEIQIEEKRKDIQIKSKRQPLSKKNKITRIIAAVAACALIVVGVTTILQNDEVVYFEGTEYVFESEIVTSSDYTQIYNTIQRVNAISDSNNSGIGDFFSELFNPTKGNSNDMMPEPEIENEDFSGTHEQTEGVDEADLMKTDGKYIYFVSNGSLNIIQAENGDLTHLATTEKSDDFVAIEMFLFENTAVVIKEPKLKKAYGIVAEDEANNSDENTIKDTDITIVEIYDVTDKANPSLKSSYTQKGRYNTSRMIEDKLYISTSYRIVNEISNQEETYKYIPCYEINGKESLILPEDINVAKECKTLNYTILSGLDVNATNPLISTKAVLGYDGVAYTSADNFYIAGAKFDDEKSSTAVLRFSIKDGVIDHTGSGVVDGIVLNQFSIDEYNGFLRIATTANNKGKISNGVYVLDDTLKQVGKIDGIAKNEQIKSVRFEGDDGYIVTFLKTDPLYKIDLSNPKSPKVLSEVKIDGYSKYLQEFGEDKLLGIGVNADENGNVTNLKITMFSKGENGEQKEIVSQVFGDKSASAYDEFDHKAYLVDDEKNLIGIPSMYFDGVDYCNEYYVYKFVENKFEPIGVYSMHSHDNNDNFSRSMYIGDYIYLFNKNSVVSLDIKNLSKKSALVF